MTLISSDKKTGESLGIPGLSGMSGVIIVIIMIDYCLYVIIFMIFFLTHPWIWPKEESLGDVDDCQEGNGFPDVEDKNVLTMQ